ncbi:gamma-interferon-responsive lysosomal thiol protein-like [Rutidosis leptorrhynchoides]|uniref:gamma-interferon-responsive lysosomal thiol protein-like n=1 Tax=Rutidosis leptorrhynchoides TaxID=125765 RepID=UPI003A99B953
MATYHKMLVLLLFLLTMAKSCCVEDKVKVSLYYESLCPYCSDFIVNQLGKALFHENLISIVDLNLVPWGNTQLAPNNALICQHGPDECSIDIVEACAIDVLSQQALRYKLIQCMENLNLEGRHGEWRSCMSSLNIYPKPIIDCYQTRKGFDLEMKFADETNHLNPPHRFVPWVLVNNTPLQEDYQNFVAYICKAYTGQNKPKVCEQHVLEANSVNKEPNSTSQVCYRGEIKHSVPFSYN